MLKYSKITVCIEKRRAEYLSEMSTKKIPFFSAASCKKDIIFGGHLTQVFGLSYFITALISFKENITKVRFILTNDIEN